MNELLTTQHTLQREPAGSAEHVRVIARLRKAVPESVLAHFLRLIAQGNKGVARVANGVCSACHLRVASGTVAALRNQTDLHLCEHCGCYLMLAPEEIAPPTPAPAVVRPKRRLISPSAV